MRRLCWLTLIIAVSAVTHAGEVLDRIVATVDRHAITRSDVEEEARFAHLVDGSKAPVTVQDEIAALGRLVDRSLVNNQIAAFGMTPVSKQDIDARIEEMRRQIPGAKSDETWTSLLQTNDLNAAEISDRVNQEVQTLRFVDLRFRSEVRVGPRALQTYYETRFVPEMKKKNVTPPPLDKVQDQIEAVLREERVNALISDWLKTLRGQSRIQTFDSDLPLPLEKKTPDLSDLHFLPLHITGASEATKHP